MTLPADPQKRIMTLVERSAPRRASVMPPAARERLAETDRRRAGCYASMEDISERFGELADEVDAAPNADVVALSAR